MTVDSFIDRMRVKQAALFDTTVTVARAATAGAFDTTTASYAAPSSAPVYSGPALVRPEMETSTVDEGGTSVEVAGYLVKLPVDTEVEVGDVVTVTASDHDAGLAGLTLRVLRTQRDEWQIARRAFAVDQQARPT